jgi:phospholipase D
MYPLYVFQFALTLALSAVSPLLQSAASASTDAAIAVCFAPEEDCAAFAVRAIDNAEREILVAAYRLTVGSGIVGALIRAKERGVDVRVIADRAAPCGRASGIDPLGAAGVPIWIDDRARLAHAKTMVRRRHCDPDGLL